MFTVKLMTGPNNETIDVFEAHTIRVQRRKHIDAPNDTAIVLDAGKPTEFWYYVTSEPSDGHYRMAVIENAAGKTTEVVHP